MKQIVEKFDRSYIINLRERPDRRREAIEEFARVGIALPHPKVEFYTAERPTEKGPFASIGQRGVFNSHRDVLRRAIERNLSNVLVFEDDVFFRDVPGSEIAKMLTPPPRPEPSSNRDRCEHRWRSPAPVERSETPAPTPAGKAARSRPYLRCEKGEFDDPFPRSSSLLLPPYLA
jgi:hypothetical protein